MTIEQRIEHMKKRNELSDESVDECRFLCQWNSGLRCTKNPNERNCHKRVSGEVGEQDGCY